ncbi:MAG: hypothetical protein JWM72_2010 [Actinomycetia bacterium]|jgi:hypothetical protein|nr:hypothetical protein [Actinomycetes bacterium]
MSEPEPTRPSSTTRAEEETDARVKPSPDSSPTAEEEAAAARADALDEDEKRAYKEAIERGARQEGEGRLP